MVGAEESAETITWNLMYYCPNMTLAIQREQPTIKHA